MDSSPWLIQLDQDKSDPRENVVLEAESYSLIEGRSSEEQANFPLEEEDAEGKKNHRHTKANIRRWLYSFA